MNEADILPDNAKRQVV